jgi:hypothetical protein
MARHQQQSHDIVAPVTATNAGESEEEAVAAVKNSSRKGGHSKDKKKYKHHSSLPFYEKKCPLCWLHICFGEKARRCEQPCAWSSPAEN